MKRSKKEILSHITKEINSARIIDNNTLEINYQDGSKAIRLHDTDVVTFDKDNNIILNSGGWLTPTTKNRINEYSPLQVYQSKRRWYVQDHLFYDGITFNQNNELISEELKDNIREISKMRKKIKAFVSLVDTLDKIPEPNGGDCWYCYLQEEKTGKALGDVTSSDHLTQHIEEGYLTGSLIFNALKERGYISPQTIMMMNCKESIKRALTRYLQKRLIPEIA